MQYVESVPASTLDWKPSEGKFSTGDLLRHIGSSQLMFLSVFESGEWTYPGHDISKGETIEEITIAVSLGDAETLIQHPASMTHACIPEKVRVEMGISNELVRLSVGLESWEDIWQDLEQALDTL